MKLKNKKIGLSIRGGGTKSVAYAGVLKAFEELEIPIHAIVSASGGSAVATYHALGLKPEQILENLKKVRPYSIFSLRSLIRGRIADYREWEEFAQQATQGKRIEDTQIKLFIQATNVNTHELEYIETGDLAKAVVASSAILYPYKFKHRQYVDGEYSPAYGIDKLEEFGCDITFIINLHEGRKRFSLLDIARLSQAKAFKFDENLHPADFKISVRIPATFPFSLKGMDKIFDHGYKQALRFIQNL